MNAKANTRMGGRNLAGGLETRLARAFKDGVGLSEGKWQKIALGRAMMRPAQLVLVLDEPTAALDAPSEHALFERYAGAARRVAATNGGVTLLVSHRFSTVRLSLSRGGGTLPQHRHVDRGAGL